MAEEALPVVIQHQPFHQPLLASAIFDAAAAIAFRTTSRSERTGPRLRPLPLQRPLALR